MMHDSDDSESDSSFDQQTTTTNGATNKNMKYVLNTPQGIMHNDKNFNPNTDAMFDPALNMITPQNVVVDGPNNLYQQQQHNINLYNQQNNIYQPQQKVVSAEQCEECGAVSMGRKDDEGIFYCNVCWSQWIE